MKRVIFICTIILSAVVLTNSGCKKDLQKKDKESELMNLTLTESLEEELTVNEQYEFLVFANRTTFMDFRELALASTHAELKEYLEEDLRFSSLGSTMYGSEYDDSLVTDDELGYYTMNEDRVVQVEDVIMQQKNDSIALAMRSDYLDQANYEKIAEGVYDSDCMNQFAENPGEEDEWGIIDFTSDDPTGYYEDHSEAALPPRFIGTRWDPVDHGNCCNNGVVTNFARFTKHFFFVRTQVGYLITTLPGSCTSNQSNACVGGVLDYL